MNIATDGEMTATACPAAIVTGDFNVGKSLLLNALLRTNLLFTGREESRIPPTFVTRGAAPEICHAAWKTCEPEAVRQSHAQFLGARQMGGTPCEYDGLAAFVPYMPFSRLLFVDTPGGSTETNESALWPETSALQQALFVVIANIEYWPARHTMRLIEEHQERCAGRFIVAANMADQLNPAEIRRICDKAGRRMENAGIQPAPPFFPVSARLEAGRHHPEDEYRMRIKRDVRDLCDAGFDALRVALYEFEAQCPPTAPLSSFEALFNSDIAATLMAGQTMEAPC